MSIRYRAASVTIALLIFSICNSLFAESKLPATQWQMMIDSIKARGEEYSPALWHAADNDLIARKAATAAALNQGNDSRDGGNGPANAVVVSANNYQDNGTTSGKGNNASLPSCLSGGSDTAPDAWYVVTLSESVTIDVWTTCAFPSTYDTRVGIFNSSLALVACNDDDPSCNPNLQSRIEDQPLNAGTYYVVVDGYNGNSGVYQVNVAWTVQGPPCGGSNQANAQMISTLPYTSQGSTVGSCDDIMVGCELSGPDNAEDYWYRVSLDTTTLLTVWTSCSSSWFDSKIAIFDQALTQIYCNDDNPACGSKQSRIANAALDPGDYFIVVDGYHSSAGNYEINVEGVPFDANDVDTLLPDIIIKRDDLYDNEISTTVVPGKRHIKLTVTTPNIGTGKLYVYGVLPANGDGTQDIRQRVYRSDGTFFDRLAGKFVYHAGHGHIHVENWTQFHLRNVLPDSSAGPVVASGDKTSFCILDLGVYNSSLPNFNPSGQFFSCSSTIQGLSVGWADTYSKDLPGQNIDITNVPDGVYWLEAVSDPDTTILEASDNNNASRVLVVIGEPNPINADAYESNNDFDQVDARPIGAANSPNLGPCNPVLVLDSLNIHQFGNDDYFKFYCNATGAAGDRVRIDFDDALGDLDMKLYDATRFEVGSSTGGTNFETITLNNKAEGWYYVRVYGNSGAVNPLYSLSINPPANNPPSVTVVDPPVGDTTLIHGVDTYKVGWNSSDPENDLCWVTVYVDTIPVKNGDEFMLPTSLHTSASQGFYIINSAYLPDHQSLYVYCEITDGGVTTGDWSSGTITFIDQGHSHGMISGMVIDSDSLPIGDAIVYLNNHEHEDTTIATGLFMLADIEPGFYTLTVSHPLYDDTTLTNVGVNVGGTKDKTIVLYNCSYVAGDADGSTQVNISDAVFLINYIFAGGPTPLPSGAGDANCDSQISISDVVHLINYIFAGGAPPCRVGC